MLPVVANFSSMTIGPVGLKGLLACAASNRREKMKRKLGFKGAAMKEF
jgi:hypothetical protein